MIASVLRLVEILKSSATTRLIISSSGWSFYLQVLAKISVMIFSVVAARQLGVTDFGLFASVQAVSLLAVSAWDSGFSQFLVREVSASPDELSFHLGAGWKAKVVMLPVFFMIVLGGLSTLNIDSLDHRVGSVILASGSVLSGLSLMLTGGLQAKLRFRQAAIASSTGRISIAVLSLGLLFVEVTMPFTVLAMVLLVGEIIVFASQVSVLGMGQVFGLSNVGVRESLRMQKRALPYGLNGFFVLVYNRMDVILVAWLAGTHQAGLYAPASRIQDALAIIPSTLSGALVPIFTNLMSAKEGAFHAIRFVVGMSVVSIGVMLFALILTAVASQSLLPAILGVAYSESTSVVQVVIWSLLFSSAAQPFFSYLVAIGHARLLNLVYGAILIVSLVGHGLLDPHFGAIGAAWVAVLRDLVGAVIGVTISLVFFRRAQALNVISMGRTS